MAEGRDLRDAPDTDLTIVKDVAAHREPDRTACKEEAVMSENWFLWLALGAMGVFTAAMLFATLTDRRHG